MSLIAVLGAAFDPPTKGHLDVINQCLETCDAVWLVPSFAHAFNKTMSEYDKRLEMVNAFLSDVNDKRVSLKDCEPQVKAQGPVYSIDMMRYLKSHFAGLGDKLHLVLGPDNHQQFERFHEHQALRKEFPLLLVEEHTLIRSSLVRDLIKAGESVEEYLTDRVSPLASALYVD